MLHVMVDVCTVEAQNVVVAVQDTLNDDLIMHQCNEDDTKTTSEENNFKLNPTNERCSTEQVSIYSSKILA